MPPGTGYHPHADSDSGYKHYESQNTIPLPRDGTSASQRIILAVSWFVDDIRGIAPLILDNRDGSQDIDDETGFVGEDSSFKFRYRIKR